MKKTITAFIAIIVAVGFGAVTFVQQPTISNTGGAWSVSFELSQATDVEVAIISKVDSSIVRHLAAGVLGTNPPAPLAANVLNQNISWDGKDDLGRTVTLPVSSLAVRVRAKMGVSLDKMVGGSDYAFQFNSGIYINNGGHLFVLGGGGANSQRTLREYDGDGNYIKTVFPYPSSHASARVTGFGVWNWLDGTYSPVTSRAYGPALSNTMIATEGALLSYAEEGKLVVGDIRTNKVQIFNQDGSIDGNGLSVKLVTSPVNYPNHYYIGGPFCATMSRDNKNVYLSGVYSCASTASGQADNLALAPDTGFWRDGQVFKVNVATGVATSFIALDSVPVLVSARKAPIGILYGGDGYHYYSAIHGTAVDDSGHVFICDRLHDRIGVYDTAGTYLGGIPVMHPDLVEINRQTGEIFVSAKTLTGYGSGYVRLYKFAGWRNSPAPVCSLNFIPSATGAATQKTYMGLSTSGSKPMLWIVHNTSGIRAYRDDGNALTLVKNFTDLTTGVNMGFDRMDVDPATETVYLNNAWSGFYKVDDWTNPALAICSSSTGKRLRACDFALSRDGQIYLREDTKNGDAGNGAFAGPITRYSLGRLLTPANWENSGTNVMTSYIYSRYHGTGGFAEKGLGVSPVDKRVGIMYMYAFAKYFVGEFADSGCTDLLQHVDSVVNPMNSAGYFGGGGVKYDSKGNLYVGVASPYITNREIIDGVTAVNATRFQGNVVRFTRNTKGSILSTGLVGADKVYETALSPFSGTWGECACRSPRFDLDYYDRIYLPSGLTQQITVIDNNGNKIIRFGSYGNVDSKGTGSLVAAPAIPFGWPVAVAASDDYIYVSDMINTRIVRVKMNFELDNMPGYGLSTGDVSNTYASPKKKPFFSLYPNPFNPTISIVLSGVSGKVPVHYEIISADGKTVLSSMHTGKFVWNAARFPSGIYVVKATLGSDVLTGRIMLVK